MVSDFWYFFFFYNSDVNIQVSPPNDVTSHHSKIQSLLLG